MTWELEDERAHRRWLDAEDERKRKKMRTLLVYIAGPFTAPNAHDFARNVWEAEQLGRIVAEAGAYPVIPHSNTRNFVGLKSHDFWYAGTLSLMCVCDAIALTARWRESKGAIAESDHASVAQIPSFDFSYPELAQTALCKWLKERVRS